jgi:hypothetical protein
MRDSLLIVFVGLLLFLSTQVRAQDTETIADVHCIIVGLRFSGMEDPNQRTAGSMLSIYYIGRLDGRVRELDLEELIVKEAGTMTNRDLFAAEAKRCGATLAARGKEITQLGKDIVERGSKTSAEQAK